MEKAEWMVSMTDIVRVLGKAQHYMRYGNSQGQNLAGERGEALFEVEKLLVKLGYHPQEVHNLFP